MWAGRTRRARGRGPPAAPTNARQARSSGNRLDDLGYDVTVQRFPLPEGRSSLNVVGRTPGPLRVIIVAHMDGVPGTRAAQRQRRQASG